jgi:hypothetical protein
VLFTVIKDSGRGIVRWPYKRNFFNLLKGQWPELYIYLRGRHCPYQNQTVVDKKSHKYNFCEMCENVPFISLYSTGTVPKY